MTDISDELKKKYLKKFDKSKSHIFVKENHYLFYSITY